MAREHINIDKKELVLIAKVAQGNGMNRGNVVVVVNLVYDQIDNITFEKYTEKSLFRSYESEKIIIKTKKTGDPLYIFKKKDEKEHFESYKAGLTKFAKDNRVPLNTGGAGES